MKLIRQQVVGLDFVGFGLLLVIRRLQEMQVLVAAIGARLCQRFRRHERL